MKFPIEEYKGFEIVYNDDSDKFECSMELNDSVKNAKRGSLADMRKEIDQFIKANSEFRPFWFLGKSRYSSELFEKLYCAAIRTDGKLVVKYKESDTGYQLWDKSDMVKRACILDLGAVDAHKLAKLQKDEANKKYTETISELNNRLVSLDLSKYGL